MNYNLEHFIEELNKLHIELDENQINQFINYYEMLIEKNKVMNLTAITDFDEVIDKHFIDSLNLFRLVDLKSEKYILDLGTGAGFPGIPLKIAFPNIRIVLADSLNKRILFLKDVVDNLCLNDVECVHGRAEDLARNSSYRESFDLCVSRAVANLSTLSEYCIPFVKKGGQFISYKSDNCENAICEIDNCEADTYREDIYIEDKYLEEQSGAYHFLLKNGKVSITKTEAIKTDGMQSISIAALTDYLFGKKEDSIDSCETLTEEGKMLLKNICPLSENCIMEIV